MQKYDGTSGRLIATDLVDGGHQHGWWLRV